ncbi:hypothetical protein EDD17DRAFT_1499882, partial [Pisolithus thermaeus]
GGVGKLTYRFSGGRQYDRCNCFNLRLMWRYSGIGELYAYTPSNRPIRRLCLRCSMQRSLDKFRLNCIVSSIHHSTTFIVHETYTSLNQDIL